MNSSFHETCCFTGHRKLDAQSLDAITQAIRTNVMQLLAKGVVSFRLGGAVGFDTLAASVLFEMRKDHPEINVTLYYPFPEYYANWPQADMERYFQLLPQYDASICVCDHTRRPSYAFLKRDRRLVDGSRYVIAYCTKKTGGTAYTLRYAEKQGCEIINLAAQPTKKHPPEPRQVP